MSREHTPGLTEDLRALIVKLAGLEVSELEAVEDALADRARGLLSEEGADLLRSHDRDPERVLRAFRTLTGREPGRRGRSRR